MAREYMCQYANCTETTTPIVVTDRRSMITGRFCCKKHAALYLLSRYRRLSLADLDELEEQLKALFP